MRAAINSSTNILRMIFGVAGRRVHRSPTTRSVVLRTEEETPRVSSRSRHPQGPTCIQRIIHRFPHVFVCVVGHVGIILPSPRRIERVAVIDGNRGRTASCPNRPRTDPGVPFSSTGLFRNTRFRVRRHERKRTVVAVQGVAEW